jgi:hypothetical protein
MPSQLYDSDFRRQRNRGPVKDSFADFAACAVSGALAALDR